MSKRQQHAVKTWLTVSNRTGSNSLIVCMYIECARTLKNPAEKKKKIIRQHKNELVLENANRLAMLK